MPNLTATIVDTTGIQKYIFGSNRLKENVGASHLVKLATDYQVKGSWLRECFESLGNVYIPENNLDVDLIITEDPSIIAEIVYAGGGNTVLLFRHEENAKEFTRKLTKTVLQKARGLNLAVAHHIFDWETHKLLDVIAENLIKTKLGKQKRNPLSSVPLLGLSVTANCISTGLVAVGSREIDGTSRLVSEEVLAKLANAENSNKELKQIILDGNSFEVPYDVDDLGRSEQESSYIAVVHIDGNQMGKRFENVGKEQYENKLPSEGNRDFVKAMRNLSRDVSFATETALKLVGHLVVESIDSEKKVKGKFQIKQNFIPFRPIIYGGDDVTFVCDGRIGLSLAVKFLKEFERLTENLPDGQGKKSKATACAGIAIVKTHYPFARAYELSEALCSKAKKLVRDETDNYSSRNPIFSALDWHIAASGLLGDIDEIRSREYQDSMLTIRPMRSHEYGGKIKVIWQDFTNVIQCFKEGKEWKDKHNKVMALREILTQGEDATKKFLEIYGKELLPEFPRVESTLREKGWLNSKCYYFDAIEAMDFYIPMGE
ncbi:hypothetical protein H6F44_11000 [Pseudanabaena sp. FACHB-1277]|uniref:Cas10/Cmr2 second palm domain-containing protein n=1 Tax=Pseudanabaena cinerea FACHB-1277 TaxID=2949581 RepID=A0A926UTX9_9CYAN|nr:hypothetical protein [Pseudanabaena cinerea]MBD2150643.1 hypothetical protein [Pseudanabaena cinerea FACHB-1277]